MSIQSRKSIYSRIEDIRQRPLIVYMTSPRANASGRMGGDVISEICDQIEALPEGCKKVDLLLVSNGGDGLVAWRAISMLRERVDEIGVLIPQTAYSAATLLALGADEIVMHPFANLGPIDPQIDVSRKGDDGKTENIHFGSEDMEGFLEFAREKVGLTDQSNMLEVFRMFCKEVGTVPIGIAARSSLLSQQLGVKLLQSRKKKPKDERKSKTIVDRLNKKFFNHGYALSRTEAKEIGLKVIYPDHNLENAMWSAWREVEKDFKIREPFNAMEMIAACSGSEHLFEPAPSVPIPSNTPPALVQQIWQQVLSSIQVVKSPKVEYTTPYALLESVRLQRMYIEKGIITATRVPQGGIGINITKTSQKWDDSIDGAN